MNPADIKMAIDLADQLDDGQDSFRVSKTLMDCGNEIERLQAEVARYETSPTVETCRKMIEDQAVKENAVLRKQIALLREALSAMLTHMGMDEDEWNKVTFDQARSALAATSPASDTE